MFDPHGTKLSFKADTGKRGTDVTLQSRAAGVFPKLSFCLGNTTSLGIVFPNPPNLYINTEHFL